MSLLLLESPTHLGYAWNRGNAYYFHTEVFIGGGLLVEPFYHKDYPFEHILAGLGFVIAHEVGHSFGPRAAE